MKKRNIYTKIGNTFKLKLLEVILGTLFKIITPLHQSTNRNYIKRMLNKKVECMIESKKYALKYCDGNDRNKNTTRTHDGENVGVHIGTYRP